MKLEMSGGREGFFAPTASLSRATLLKSPLLRQGPTSATARRARFFRRARPICCRKTFPLVQLRAAHGSDLRVSWIFEEFRALEKVDFYDDTRVESDRVRAMPGFLCHARTRMLAAHCRKDWKNVSFNANVLFTFELFYFSKTIKLLL